MYDLKDYLNSVNYKKNNLMVEDADELWEKKYPTFIVNKCVSGFADTFLFANEMNGFHHMEKKLQYDFTNAIGWIYTEQEMNEELKRVDIDVDQEYRCQYTSARSSIFGVIGEDSIEEYEAEEYGSE